MFYVLQCLILLYSLSYSVASSGDASPYYQKCLERCSIFNCTDDGQRFKDSGKQSSILFYTHWSCEDECSYECMWKTVDAFHERKWRTPQFYGKWPFIRLLGMQEPASVFFSLLNGYVHIKMIRKFRRDVRADSPLTWLWQTFFLVCIHAWFWSAVFHTRDFPMTELLDYACAFSMVLMSCYVMLIRLLRGKVPSFGLATITVFFIALFANHAAYLNMTDRIDYTYNMELNITIGTFTAICWFGWCTYIRKRQPYVWKCAIFVALTGIVMLLEIIDRPPILYVFDFHSLWHLATAPLTVLIYSFAIDDCKYLRKTEKELQDLEGSKKHP